MFCTVQPTGTNRPSEVCFTRYELFLFLYTDTFFEDLQTTIPQLPYLEDYVGAIFVHHNFPYYNDVSDWDTDPSWPH